MAASRLQNKKGFAR